MRNDEKAIPVEQDEARLGLYHCLRQLASEAATLDLPDVMLAIAKAASLVRVTLEPEPEARPR